MEASQWRLPLSRGRLFVASNGRSQTNTVVDVAYRPCRKGERASRLNPPEQSMSMDIELKSTSAGTVVTCATCRACCCRLEVMIMGDDEVPVELTEPDHWGGRIMARSADGWCAALDRDTLRCRIYEHRPTVCRDYQMGGSECITERSAAKL